LTGTSPDELRPSKQNTTLLERHQVAVRRLPRVGSIVAGHLSTAAGAVPLSHINPSTGRIEGEVPLSGGSVLMRRSHQDARRRRTGGTHRPSGIRRFWSG